MKREYKYRKLLHSEPIKLHYTRKMDVFCLLDSSLSAYLVANFQTESKSIIVSFLFLFIYLIEFPRPYANRLYNFSLSLSLHRYHHAKKKKLYLCSTVVRDFHSVYVLHQVSNFIFFFSSILHIYFVFNFYK